VSGETRSVASTLELADWRRLVADLYVDVRRLGATDPVAAFDHWRTTREELFRGHPQSPLPAARRAAFRAAHFPYDPALRFEVGLTEPDEAPFDVGTGGFAGLSIDLPVSAGGGMAFERLGVVAVHFAEGPRRLEMYWMEGYAGGLFLPFRDGTNGSETYGAGRYLLDAAKSADLGGDLTAGTLVLDFNFAFQPSCAWDPQWACPLAPPANRLDLPIRAGERLS
jgi:uncharacterized protein (DUF1684 family)